MNKVLLSLLGIAIVAALTSYVVLRLRSQDQAAPTLSYFVYQDTIPNLKATVYLPGAADEWGVQNPYKEANRSLVKSPQVFVKAAFQNIQNPAIYGVLHVIYDMKGLDCYSVFTGLAQLDGLRLQTYSSTSSNTIAGSKGYIFEYYQDQKNLIVGSRVVCDNTYGLELMVVAPNNQQYNATIETILKDSQLTIPGTPTASGGSDTTAAQGAP